MTSVPYAEIGAATNFSFLRGASRPEELVVAALHKGLVGFGVADRNSVAGVVRAHQAAREAGLAYAPGARLVFSDETPDILAFPRDRAGWGRLCRLLTLGNLRTVKGDCVLRLADLIDWSEGLNLALVAPIALGRPDPAGEAARAAIAWTLQTLAGPARGHLRLALAPRHDGLDARRLAEAVHLATAAGTPLMAVNEVLYHAPQRRRMQDVVTAIREHVPIQEAGLRLSVNAERHVKSGAEMLTLFPGQAEAVAESVRFFRELAFDLTSLRYEYPDEALRLGVTPAEELRRLAEDGARKRYPGGVSRMVADQIDHELAIIGQLKYEPYFLTVQRIVEAARGMGILCQGRGSAANSTVCFCLFITDVDPEQSGLLFERFISPDRDEPPDIDVDFEHERRSEIIDWIYDTYGRDKAAIAATVISYRARSAAREVGAAFGLSKDAVSALSGSVWGYHSSDLGEREAEAAGLATQDPVTRHVLAFAEELMEFPRHLSQHVGGFVLTRGRTDETVPVLNTGSKGRLIIEWDKDDIDALKILKIDILALGMLTCLKRAFAFLDAHYPGAVQGDGEPTTLASLPMEDKDGPVWKMTHRADTLGTFQIESRAQMTMLPKLRPDCFYDLVIEVAIVRPGPIQGDMVHPYLRRKMGLERPTYPSPELEEVLHRTLGVPLFQEQAMKIAIVAAGFTPGEADQLRRAMATFKRSGRIASFREKMVKGMVGNGYEEDFAIRCFKQIEGFGEYGFPESHAASFALLVYASCWLKCHYPDVFCAALLNAQPMGFYAPAQIVRDAREHGIDVRPLCVNCSDWDSTLEALDGDGHEAEAGMNPARIVPRHREMAAAIRSRHAVRIGFRQAKGLPENEVRRLIWIRQSAGPFDSVRGFWLRTGLSRAVVERLADADAFASLGLTRRDALWAARALDEREAPEHLPLFAAAPSWQPMDEPDAHLPPMPLGEEVINDYRFLSLSLKAHPVSFVRERLKRQGVLPNARLEVLPSGRRVTVSGLVLVRQRPGSAKGVIFMTIEDETGVANVIVWPKIFESFRALVLGARFLSVTGRMQSDRGVIHVVADKVEDLTFLLREIAAGGLEETGHIAPADHVRSPLRASAPRRSAAHPVGTRPPGADRPDVLAGPVSPDLSLATVLARADEVRRPVDEARLHRRGIDAMRRAAIAASRIDSEPVFPVPDAIRSALPKGRNFH
ncbi:DNA polymerase [Aureimonas sp. Leaf454]|uniref:error-prone DNA polymerase n=1 Tax=Aureimonas sp. Leaf454 TaxID=1736381 RepID=UPI0006FD6B3F|nr:error-prone DNA polymerase [Aureimonas sp. Leaf454]KQT52703.1 DNA polymerase [Aureimonas sp. Leaf454]